MMSPLYLVLIFAVQWFNLTNKSKEVILPYHPPMTIPLVLSANFGELRSNHFHMGLDFKTEGKEGQTLHSIDNGYVSRVNISPYGYGLVVYINHPRGITSVYAHCQRLVGKLDKRAKEIQTSTENSEVDIYFQPNELILKRGEVFALSGNSGSSRGAHLHFEIRDTYTEEALNPLSFGFDIEDTKAPSVYDIKIYAVDEFGYMISDKSIAFSIKNGTIANGSVLIPSTYCSIKGGIGFAINGTDKFEEGGNTCGIYGSRVIVNGDTLMNQRLNRVAFEDTRYLNAYTDYHAFRAGRKYHKAFRTIANPLSVYEIDGLGILKITPNKSYQIQYDVYDFSGNVTSVNFNASVADGEINNKPSKAIDKYYISPSSSYNFDLENTVIYLPESCTYEPILKDISKSGSSVYFKCDMWPVQEAFTVKLKARDAFPVKQQYLAVKKGSTWSALETNFIDGWLEAKSTYFGEISIQIDEKSPNIVKSNAKGVIYKSRTSRLVWGLGDYQTGLANYGLKINGKWFPLVYESKGDYAYFDIEELAAGFYEIILLAIDCAGNKKEEKFFIELKL